MFPDDYPAIKPNVRYISAGKINTIQTTRPFRGSSTTQAIHTSNEAMRVDNPASKWIYMGAQKRLPHQRESEITPKKTMIGNSSVRGKSTVVIKPAAEPSNRGHGVFWFPLSSSRFNLVPVAAAKGWAHRYNSRDSRSSSHEASSGLARSSRSAGTATGSSTQRRSNSLPLMTSMARRSVSYS
jgi:hypothetical protein